MDKLDNIFKKQEELQLKLKNFPLKDFKEQQEFLNINFLAIIDELSECLRETSWKNPQYIKYGWKRTQEYNSLKFQEEIIDLWHFLINITIVSGLSSEQFYNKFIMKNKINNLRQDENY